MPITFSEYPCLEYACLAPYEGARGWKINCDPLYKDYLNSNTELIEELLNTVVSSKNRANTLFNFYLPEIFYKKLRRNSYGSILLFHFSRDHNFKNMKGVICLPNGEQYIYAYSPLDWGVGYKRDRPPTFMVAKFHQYDILDIETAFYYESRIHLDKSHFFTEYEQEEGSLIAFLSQSIQHMNTVNSVLINPAKNFTSAEIFIPSVYSSYVR